MESRLALLAAAQLIAVAAPRVASAEPKNRGLARQLFELGIEEYKQKLYDAAVASMTKAYQLDPEPEFLYALAQSERMNGDCNGAIAHYEKLLDLSKDDQTKTAVKANLDLCYSIAHGEKPKAQPVDAKALERQNAPTIEIRTVYRTETRSYKLAVALYAFGGVALGGAATTYVLSLSTRSDANHATSLAQYNQLFDRAATERTIAFTAGGVGLLAVGAATAYVLMGGGKSVKESNVAVMPISGGSMIAWGGSW